ncbi:MAG: 30S ribosomal protein S1 [Deltaproteobacteria bacterium]|nr:MAG: 30S ribosomal protein S1 [Deltaproteobacteria bacterium]
MDYEKDNGEVSPDEKEEVTNGEDFSLLVDSTLKRPVTGEVIRGTVVEVRDDYVFVDINYKTEGFFPTSEARDSEGNVTVKVGDEVHVMCVRFTSKGEVILSKEKADKVKLWEKLQEAYETGKPVPGRVTKKIKGGYEVDLGARAFMPSSHADLKPLSDPESIIGLEDEFKILKFSRQKLNIVVSRKERIIEEREKKKEELLATLKEGDVVEGRVKNITDYGAFIDLGGLDGLLHVTDMSYGRVSHPKEVVSVGDVVRVKVIRFDREKERISLGLKQLKPDPWTLVREKYTEGQRVSGVVTNITKYGAFIEVEEGVEGLLHISEMSWSKKLKNPSEILSIGDRVEVVILSIEEGKKKMSLGLKQLLPNPWDAIKEKYPVGSVVEGTVKSITDFGIFVDLGEEIDGLVHVSDLSWNERIKHPAELYRKGDRIKAKVLRIDPENNKFSLGIKQLREDPWKNIGERYRKGMVITGKVTSLADFGAFVELEEGVEGLLRTPEISESRVEKPQDVLKIGEVVTALITSVDEKEKKISLSIRAYQRMLEKKEMEEYMKKESSEEVTVLGEALKSLKDKLNLTNENN